MHNEQTRKVGLVVLVVLMTCGLGAAEPIGGGCYGDDVGTVEAPVLDFPFEEVEPGVWTFDGDLLPAGGGGVGTLGSVSHEWNVWAQDVFAHGSIVSGDAMYPLFDNAFGPGDAHELGARNVPVAWGRITASRLSTGPRYNVESVLHTGIGRYRVVLYTGVGEMLVPTVTIVGTGQRRDVNVMPVDGRTFDIYVVNDRGAFTDCDVTFQVFGF